MTTIMTDIPMIITATAHPGNSVSKIRDMIGI